MTAATEPEGVDADAQETLSTSRRIARLAEDAPSEKVTLGWIMGQLGERAFGLFLLILALPCCIPFLYGVPQVVALPLLFIAAQIVAGRHAPWLPERLSNREIAVSSLEDLSRRAGPWLEFVENFARPRLSVLTRPPLDRLIGLALLLFSASILLPIPSTNTVPGIAVAIVAIGFLQRDGLFVILGTVLGTAWISFLVFAGATIIDYLRTWWGG